MVGSRTLYIQSASAGHVTSLSNLASPKFRFGIGYRLAGLKGIILMCFRLTRKKVGSSQGQRGQRYQQKKAQLHLGQMLSKSMKRGRRERVGGFPVLLGGQWRSMLHWTSPTNGTNARVIYTRVLTWRELTDIIGIAITSRSTSGWDGMVVAQL